MRPAVPTLKRLSTAVFCAAAMSLACASAALAGSSDYIRQDMSGELTFIPDDGSAAVSVTDPNDGSLPNMDGTRHTLALSPDGQMVVYEQNQGLYESPTSGGPVRLLLQGGEYVPGGTTGGVGGAYFNPVWSPDGRYVYFDSNGQGVLPAGLTRINRDGSNITTLNLRDYNHPSMSKSGDLAFETDLVPPAQTTHIDPQGDWQIVYRDTQGGFHQVTRDVTGTLTGATTPAFSPDGTQLAFVGKVPAASKKTVPTYDIFKINRDGTGLTRLTSDKRTSPDFQKLVWSPTGKILFFIGGVTPYIPQQINPDGTGRSQFGSTSLYDLAYRQTNQLDPGALLAEYAPVLRYGIGQNYYADNVAEITDNAVDNRPTGSFWYNQLLASQTGPTIATALGGLGWDQLNLGYLGSVYPNGAAATADHHLDESNDTKLDDARRMHANGYGDQMYGHVVHDLATGKWWLEYWFFTYYNEKQWADLTGDHEGDWEMVQIRLDASGAPEAAVYAQHKSGERCAWHGVQREWTAAGNFAPVVYVAEGSEASYFRAGQTTWFPGFTDVYNGDGRRVEPALHDLDVNTPSWVSWPGAFGNSDNSPHGPSYGPEHPQWADPKAFSDAALSCADLSATIAKRSATKVSTRLERVHVRAAKRRNRVLVRYSLGGPSFDRRPPRRLAVTLVPSGNRYTPVTSQMRVRSRRGMFTLKMPAGPSPRAVVVRGVTRDGRVGRAVKVRLTRRDLRWRVGTETGHG